ncbi:hypothetical protein HZA40_04435 [Candidatus Peregrinibacteria bacterium]|nr:hypothetical protein [Candidatus Peregrinibacteria bacterium]
MKKFFVGLAVLSMTALLTACNSGEKAAPAPVAPVAPAVTVTPDAAKTDATAPAVKTETKTK